MSVPSHGKAARPPRRVRLQQRLVHAGRIGLRAIWQGLVEFTKSENLTFAASIAYYSLLSIFPFSLLVLAVSGRIQVGTSGASLLQLFMAAMPAEVEFLVRIETLSESAVQLGAAGMLLMMWASMGVFGALTSAINHAWGVEQPPGFFKHKLIAFVMLLAGC
jgi:membrane protein